jgi:chorismate dehydratase
MRIAASTYLNSAPLTFSFSKGRYRDRYVFLGDAAPSRCAAMLARGECDIALIPVIEYQRVPGLRIIPEIAVASKDRVRSVLIASRGPLEEVRDMALDASSRTSQTLVKILFLERYGRLPRLAERTPDLARDGENLLEGVDAALMIGDPAMRLAISAAQLGLEIHDLAVEWRTMTGLPFVFAVWAMRDSIEGGAQEVVRDFQAAKREGIDHLQRIAADYSNMLHLPESDLLSYLSENVNYELDHENLRGLELYYRYAHKHGLIPQHRPVIFAGDVDPIGKDIPR